MSIKKPFGVKRSTKPPASATKFSLAEIINLCLIPILEHCFAGKDFTAANLKTVVRAFDVYQRSNAIGDALGHSHKGSMGLYCVPDKSPRLYEACYENAALVYDAMSDFDLEQVTETLGFDADELREKIGALPKSSSNLDLDECVETGDLMSDLNDDLERFPAS